MIVAIGIEGARVLFMFVCAMDAEMFCVYVKEVLVPELNEGDIVAMDNL